METLTHYKKLRNPDYMGAYCMPTDGSEIILTIKSVAVQQVANTEGKKSDCTVVYWQEPNWKPMILNAINSKVIAKVAKSPYIEKWVGVKVQIYTAKVKAFGDEHDALRIRTFAPQITEAKTPDPHIDEQAIKEATDKIKACSTLSELQTVYKSFTPQMQRIQAIITEKDNMKTYLQATEQK
jgi:hypothetical protein